MKYRLPLALLSLLATACSGGISLSGVSIVPNVTGAQVTVTTNSAEGTYGVVAVQPSVTFHVNAGSSGAAITQATVEVVDSSGNAYGNAYANSYVAVLPMGYTCPADPSGVNCAPAERQPVARQVSTTGYLLSQAVANQIANDCLNGPDCPDVRLNITFTGKDANQAPIALTVNRVPVAIEIKGP